MSYFVVVTFDLSNADISDYRKVHSELEKIDFSKFITGRKRIATRLPHNTFVAKFDSDDFDRSKAVCAYVCAEIKRIFKDYKVAGKYFVVSGRKWAWKKGVTGKLPHKRPQRIAGNLAAD